MQISDDFIETINISEPELMDKILNVKKNWNVFGGVFPDSYSGKLYEGSQSVGSLDFTKSFISYMIHNRKLLNFDFEVVNLPTYLVFYIDTKISNSGNSTTIPTATLNLCSAPGVVKTRKTPVQMTKELLRELSDGTLIINKIYDMILSDLNQLMIYRQDSAIYFYQLTALSVGDIYNFMARFGISQKGIANIKPNGQLPNAANGPLSKLGLTN